MFASMKLGRFFGIDTYIHGTFWLLPLFVLFSNFSAGLDEIAFKLLFVFAVFFCVALHEVGHALAARAYGIRTRNITLYPIGGVASLERMPEKPWQEVAVALAGPAVNVAIAIGLLAGLVAGGLVMPWASGPDVVTEFVGQLFFANVFLCLFNLLPAFPMDGGRVLRSLLSMGLGNLRATRIAVNVGMVMAALIGIVGTYYLHSPFMLVIALFVFVAGQAELQAAYFRAQRRAEDIAAPVVRPVAELPTALFCLQPRITVYTWDKENGRWIRETRDGATPAL